MERLSVSSHTKELCVPALSNPGVRSSAGVLIAEYLVIKNEYQGGLKTWRAGRCAAALGTVLTTRSWKFTQRRTEEKRNSWGWMCSGEGESLPGWGNEGMKIFPISPHKEFLLCLGTDEPTDKISWKTTVNVTGVHLI